MRYIFIAIFFSTFFMLNGQVFAQSKYNIKEMTPEVQAALDNRRNRFDQLSTFKAKGIIGENNHGYVEVLVSDSEAETLADQENQDRQVIYKTIAQQNDLTDAMGTIEKAFAETQRERAASGEKIQDSDGAWASK